jgi:hypothetical protein
MERHDIECSSRWPARRSRSVDPSGLRRAPRHDPDPDRHALAARPHRRSATPPGKIPFVLGGAIDLLLDADAPAFTYGEDLVSAR